MKRKYFYMFISIISMLVVLSCSNYSSDKDDDFGIIIKLPGTEARSIVYTENDVNKYRIQITKSNINIKDLEAKPNDELAISLEEEGLYTITIDAYDSNNTIIASGTKSQNILRTDGYTEISIDLIPKIKKSKFNIFISNDESDVSTIYGYRVTIYNSDRIFASREVEFDEEISFDIEEVGIYKILVEAYDDKGITILSGNETEIINNYFGEKNIYITLLPIENEAPELLKIKINPSWISDSSISSHIRVEPCSNGIKIITNKLPGEIWDEGAGAAINCNNVLAIMLEDDLNKNSCVYYYPFVTSGEEYLFSLDLFINNVGVSEKVSCIANITNPEVLNYEVLNHLEPKIQFYQSSGLFYIGFNSEITSLNDIFKDMSDISSISFWPTILLGKRDWSDTKWWVGEQFSTTSKIENFITSYIELSKTTSKSDLSSVKNKYSGYVDIKFKYKENREVFQIHLNAPQYTYH